MVSFLGRIEVAARVILFYLKGLFKLAGKQLQNKKYPRRCTKLHEKHFVLVRVFSWIVCLENREVAQGTDSSSDYHDSGNFSIEG